MYLLTELQRIKQEMSCRRVAYCSVRRVGSGLRERCGKTVANETAVSERQMITNMLTDLSQLWNNVHQLTHAGYVSYLSA